jgi:hypothetical protein
MKAQITIQKEDKMPTNATFDNSFILAISAIITIIVTLIIAILNFCGVLAMHRQGNILKVQAETMLKQTKATIMQKCTETYIIIRRQRSKAIEDKSEELAKDYYREICDLHWSEYILYKEDLIPHSAMKAWLDARSRNYTNDNVPIEDNIRGIRRITYAEVWNELLEKGYFEKDDPFVEFMDKVHKGNVIDVIKETA